jgi:hypothetical protein
MTQARNSLVKEAPSCGNPRRCVSWLEKLSETNAEDPDLNPVPRGSSRGYFAEHPPSPSIGWTPAARASLLVNVSMRRIKGALSISLIFLITPRYRLAAAPRDGRHTHRSRDSFAFASLSLITKKINPAGNIRRIKITVRGEGKEGRGGGDGRGGLFEKHYTGKL